MTVVVLGVDALDPDLVDPNDHPNLVLESHNRIDTIDSVAGEPSTHELWPTIITGLTPEEHGLKLEDGVAWENPLLDVGSSIGNLVLPKSVRTRVGAWLLNNTDQDTFRAEANYYEEHGLETVFDGREATAIGIPNYVTNPGTEDREHRLRRSLGDLFERDPDTESGHKSSDPESFYERCMEMAMIRIARVRRALRSRQYELVFGYTSGLDLIGHVSYDRPKMQTHAMNELDAFVGELLADLSQEDELVVVSDHGLQDGVHTSSAIVSSTNSDLVDRINSVLDVRSALDAELESADHRPDRTRPWTVNGEDGRDQVKQQLADLGYL